MGGAGERYVIGIYYADMDTLGHGVHARAYKRTSLGTKVNAMEDERNVPSWF